MRQRWFGHNGATTILAVCLFYLLCSVHVNATKRLFAANPVTQTFEWTTTMPPALRFTGGSVFHSPVRIQITSSGMNTDIDFLNEATTLRSRLRYGGVDEGLEFWTVGVERMRLTSGGNLGIGTSNTVARCVVDGSIHLTGPDFKIYSSVRAEGNLHQGRAIVHAPGDMLRINDGDFTGGVRIFGLQTRVEGRLGVGFTGDVGVTPNNHGQTTAATFHVVNNAPMSGNGELLRLERYGVDIAQETAGSIGMYINDNNVGGGEIARISWHHDGPTHGNPDEGRGMLQFSTSNVSNIDGVPEARMTIRHNGRVGIGTMNPSTLLDVAGAVTLERNTWVLDIIPVLSGGHTVTHFHSRFNIGSDRGFLLAQDNSAVFGETGSQEKFRLTLGVFNDFGGGSHTDQLWLQGGNALVQNVGTWDAEMNALIGSRPTDQETSSQFYEWRIHNERHMHFDQHALTVQGALNIKEFGMSWNSGLEWTLQTVPQNSGWHSVTYGNGLFVAVSRNGANRIMTSPDGVTWATRPSPVQNEWFSVTFGNNLFVAVSGGPGSGNRVMTSPDGITWTSRTSAADNQWSSVTYGNGLFVAVSASGTTNGAMTSPDGISWTIRSTPNNQCWSVVYGNGLFVAVGTYGETKWLPIMTSPDGITWTGRSGPSITSWMSVVFGNGIFVATASTGSIFGVMTSPNGITWTARQSLSTSNWVVTFGNELFVAVADSGSSQRVMTSPDGIVWTARKSHPQAWRAVTYGNGMFVAVAQGGSLSLVMTSGYMGEAFRSTFVATRGQLGIKSTGIQETLQVYGNIKAKPSRFFFRLAPGWVNFQDWTSFDGEIGGYSIIAGIVHLYGTISRPSGEQIDFTNIFEFGYITTLPPGVRPRYRIILRVLTEGRRVGRLDILPNGEMYLIWGNSVYVILSGLSFVAFQ